MFEGKDSLLHNSLQRPFGRVMATEQDRENDPCYNTHRCQQIQSVDDLMQQTIGGESGDETAYVALLQRLFGVVANIFQRYEKFIVGSFGGPVAVLQLAQSMQTETESHATKIVIHFMKTRKVAQLVNKIDLEVNLILYYSNLQPHSQTVGTGEAGKVSSA